MKKILIPALTAALLCSSAFALENSVAPKVTDIKNHSPKTGLIVGNSYSFYNCGVHGYLRGLTRENKQDWKARIVTISSGRLSYHDVEQYMGPHDDFSQVCERSSQWCELRYSQVQTAH